MRHGYVVHKVTHKNKIELERGNKLEEDFDINNLLDNLYEDDHSIIGVQDVEAVYQGNIVEEEEYKLRKGNYVN